jgi:hypothetical protein
MSTGEPKATGGRPYTTGTASPGRVSGNISSFEEGFLNLDVRDAVAVRRVAEREQTLFYLSVFDDEIDLRLEEFLAFGPGTSWNELTLATIALRLEPTDAVVIACAHGQVLVARGGNCNFPLYWTKVAGSILVSTVLPVDRDRRLSLAGLIACVAVVSMTYQNEPNLALRAPLSGWFRCRRGAVSSLAPDAGCVSERLIDLAESRGTELGRDHLIEAIRSAFDKFGRRQQGSVRALVELSGGFDSTLAAIAARTHGIELIGVSVHFPYYEFRFEESIQQAAAKSLSISRARLDGTALFPYAPPDWWPRLDEPATCVIALKRDLAVARLASSEGIDRVLVGQGGDQLFSEDMLEPLPAPTPLARGAFAKSAWREVELARDLMQSNSSFLRRSTLTYLYDARLDVAMKEAFGTITRSPFTDLEMVCCGLSWARLSARLGVHQGKKILADAFASELPDAVAGRRGKVCWDGVCARAYALHGNSIINEIELARGPLEHIGLDVRWLVRRIAQLASWQRTTFGRDDREVFAVYGLATWLRSWGVERVSDCSWSD